MNLNSREVLGWTALLCALVRGHWPVDSALLKGGASAKVPNSTGMTAVDVAQGKQTRMSDLIGNDSFAGNEKALRASLRDSGALGQHETMPANLKQAILPKGACHPGPICIV